MARRKIQTVKTFPPGEDLTTGAKLFDAIPLEGGNLLRFGLCVTIPTKISYTMNDNTTGECTLRDDVELKANTDYIFESVVLSGLFTMFTSVTTVVKKFIVEYYVDS